MTLSEEIRALGETIEDLDLSDTHDKVDLLEKIGASPMELLMTFIVALESYRAQKPTEYDLLRPQIGEFSSHLEGRQQFVWKKIFTCHKPSNG